MLTSFLLALREGIEAALIIGIVAGVLRQLHRPDLLPALRSGAGLAAVASAIIAAGLYAAGASLEGTAEQIFEGFAMLLAAGVLTWMIFWMHRQSRGLRRELEAQVRTNLGKGAMAIFWLAFLAVFREGVELALFLTAASFATQPLITWAGALGGLAAAAVLGYFFFSTASRLSIRTFFRVTNVIMLLVAAGLLAHGVHEFVEAGWIPAIVDPLYNINPWLSEDSIVGSLLKALLGYNGNPALIEVIVYLAYLAVLTFAVRLSSQPARQPLAAG